MIAIYISTAGSRNISLVVEHTLYHSVGYTPILKIKLRSLLLKRETESIAIK